VRRSETAATDLAFEQASPPAAFYDHFLHVDIAATGVAAALPHAADLDAVSRARCFSEFVGIVGAGCHPNHRARIQRSKIVHDLGSARFAAVQADLASFDESAAGRAGPRHEIASRSAGRDHAGQ